MATAKTKPPPSLSDSENAILEGVYQHRMLSNPQVHKLFKAGRGGRTAQTATKRLREECDPPLLQHVGSSAWASTYLMFLTRAGIATVLAGKPLEQRKQFAQPLTESLATGALQHHTLGVNDVGIAFVEAARERGDECGPLAWRHEISHPIGPGQKRGRGLSGEWVRADALLRYTLFREDGEVLPLARFIEFDRATMPTEDLVAKMRLYARLCSYVPEGMTEPGWKVAYPFGLPEVLVVFAGKERKALERRMKTVLALCAADPQIRSARGLVISCVLHDDLTRQGPFAARMRRHDLGLTQAVDWLGRAATP